MTDIEYDNSNYCDYPECFSPKVYNSCYCRKHKQLFAYLREFIISIIKDEKGE